MKKTIIIFILSIVIIIFLVYVSVQVNFQNVKANVKEQNPEISKVRSINHLGGWGEWFLEYSLEVVIDGEKFRIWTNGDGMITDKMPIE